MGGGGIRWVRVTPSRSDGAPPRCPFCAWLWCVSQRRAGGFGGNKALLTSGDVALSRCRADRVSSERGGGPAAGVAADGAGQREHRRGPRHRRPHGLGVPRAVAARRSELRLPRERVVLHAVWRDPAADAGGHAGARAADGAGPPVCADPYARSRGHGGGRLRAVMDGYGVLLGVLQASALAAVAVRVGDRRKFPFFRC